MIPTNEQIKQAVAELCGWKHEPAPETNPEYEIFSWKSPGTLYGLFQFHPSPPDYCTDRNALPEVWEYIATETGNAERFMDELVYLSHEDGAPHWWGLMSASPRLHCIAALKTCNKWPEDWEEGEDQP